MSEVFVRGDDLVTGLLDGTVADPDTAASDLLSQVFGGYPIDRLRPLLRSERTEAVRAGMWVVSELGERAADLLDDVAGLLDHPSRYVRFFALDSVLAAADRRHGPVLTRAAGLVDDPDDAIRWKTMHLLARATDTQVTAIGGPVGERFGALLALPDADLIARLADADRTARLLAAAAAARRAGTDPTALDAAIAADDPEVSSFAEEYDRLTARLRRPRRGTVGP
nr:hypothetical protein [Micromonospora sp. DSM 115978]